MEQPNITASMPLCGALLQTQHEALVAVQTLFERVEHHAPWAGDTPWQRWARTWPSAAFSIEEYRMQNCIRLSVPAPPMLEAALGYPGIARYVAFYWIPAGDELVWNEGWRSADGAWQGWLTFARHPRVAPALALYNFGDSDTPPTHWLLLDRETHTCFVGTATAVQQALYAENPAPDAAAWSGLRAGEGPDGPAPTQSRQPLPALTKDAWQAFMEGFRDVQVPITPAESHQHLAAHARVLDALIAWLDAHTR